MTTYNQWETVDFRPADGWRAIYSNYEDESGRFTSTPVVGFLIQEQRTYDEWNDELVEQSGPSERRVIAATMWVEDACVREVNFEGNEFMYGVIRVNDPDPSEEELKEWRKRQAAYVERRRQLGSD